MKICITQLQQTSLYNEDMHYPIATNRWKEFRDISPSSETVMMKHLWSKLFQPPLPTQRRVIENLIWRLGEKQFPLSHQQLVLTIDWYFLSVADWLISLWYAPVAASSWQRTRCLWDEGGLHRFDFYPVWIIVKFIY